MATLRTLSDWQCGLLEFTRSSDLGLCFQSFVLVRILMIVPENRVAMAPRDFPIVAEIPRSSTDSMIIQSLLCPKSATVISDICTGQVHIFHRDLHGRVQKKRFCFPPLPIRNVVSFSLPPIVICFASSSSCHLFRLFPNNQKFFQSPIIIFLSLKAFQHVTEHEHHSFTIRNTTTEVTNTFANEDKTIVDAPTSRNPRYTGAHIVERPWALHNKLHTTPPTRQKQCYRDTLWLPTFWLSL